MGISETKKKVHVAGGEGLRAQKEAHPVDKWKTMIGEGHLAVCVSYVSSKNRNLNLFLLSRFFNILNAMKYVEYLQKHALTIINIF